MSVNNDVIVGWVKVRTMLGVCPQFDSFVDFESGRELLTDLCNIRGVPSELVEKV